MVLKLFAALFILVELHKLIDFKYYKFIQIYSKEYTELQMLHLKTGMPVDKKYWILSFAHILYFIFSVVLLFTAYWYIGLYFLFISVVLSKYLKAFGWFHIADTLISLIVLLSIIF